MITERIEEASTTVTVNKEAKVPIFEMADNGLVGDFFNFLPELEAAL